MSTFLAGVALVVFIWLATLFAVARFGWNRLSKHFRDERTPDSYDFTMMSGMIAGIPYNHCLKAKADSEGLHIAVGVVWRPSHPPLFVPWEALREGHPTRMFCKHVHQFSIGEPQVGTLALPESVFRELRHPAETQGAL